MAELLAKALRTYYGEDADAFVEAQLLAPQAPENLEKWHAVMEFLRLR